MNGRHGAVASSTSSFVSGATGLSGHSNQKFHTAYCIIQDISTTVIFMNLRDIEDRKQAAAAQAEALHIAPGLGLNPAWTPTIWRRLWIS